MSFKFDFDEDGTDTAVSTAEGSEPHAISTNAALAELPLDQMMRNLPPKISYSTILVDGRKIRRRDLFDAKFQLLAEDGEEPSDLDSATDLDKGKYEGGFKTWECSLDLISLLSTQVDSIANDPAFSLLELGCGSALPSCFLFEHLTQTVGGTSKSHKTLFHLQDFNRQVLELVTLPNIIVAYLSVSNPDELALDEGDLELTEELLDSFSSFIKQHAIDLRFFFGDWAAYQKTSPLPARAYSICLTSETVYNKDNLPWLCHLLKELPKESSQPLVACKRLYFGLDGGEAEFLAELQRQGGRAEEVSWPGKPSKGVDRVVLRVTFG